VKRFVIDTDQQARDLRAGEILIGHEIDRADCTAARNCACGPKRDAVGPTSEVWKHAPEARA
jgi:hypothetical protein